MEKHWGDYSNTNGESVKIVKSKTEKISLKPDFIYTHDQAVKDGVFINISERYPDIVKGWYRWPVFATDNLWNEIGTLVKKRAGTSYRGYIWDLMICSRMCVKQEITPKMISFNIQLDEKETELWAAVDVNGKGNPVVTMFFPWEY